jgi:hypothetical protein
MTDGAFFAAAGALAGGAAESAAKAEVAMALKPSRAAEEQAARMFDGGISNHLTG